MILDIVEKCPLCGNFQNFKTIVDAGEAGRLAKCPCGLRFARERITRDETHDSCRFYTPTAYIKNDFSARFRQAHSDLTMIEKHTEIGKLFDVCAGSGAFLKCARDRGWSVAGNDLSFNCCTLSLHKWKIPLAYCEFIDMTLDEEKASAVTMLNSIEHLRQPVEELALAHKTLVKDGIIFIRTPLFSDEELKLKHLLPAHLFDYDEATLRRMLFEAGFVVKHFEMADDTTMIMIGKKT